MTGAIDFSRFVIAAASLLVLTGWADGNSKHDVLRFSIQEGRTSNYFYRDRNVAAHFLATSGNRPRLIAAFPAGNSGAGLWFENRTETAGWSLVQPLSPRQGHQEGQALYGVEAVLATDARKLVVDSVDAGSIRFLRGAVDPDLLQYRAPLNRSVADRTIEWIRQRPDGKALYKLVLEVLDGRLMRADGNGIALIAPPNGALHLKVVALTSEEPLTPLSADRLLKATAAEDERARNSLAFLSYKEAMLAGSWRFLTYFGRDTLLSLKLLAPVLTPVAMEAGLGAIIERAGPEGEVAHEEDIGELAVVRHLAADGLAEDAPFYDYAMIDDNLMLAPVFVDYAQIVDKSRLNEFLARQTADGRNYASVLAANAQYVTEAARPFAQNPEIANLVSLKAGHPDGNWRDSREGLGGGRYPYDVNVVLVPAALNAIVKLAAAGVLPKAIGRQAKQYRPVWRSRARPLFEVEILPSEAAERVERYAQKLQLPPVKLPALWDDRPRRIPVVALDREGDPIPVLHSDEGFAYLFGTPTQSRLLTDLQTMMLPFPAGLMTPVGLVVSNPAYAPQQIQEMFGRGHYHGTTIWSWQQAMMAAGLQRQRRRADLSVATKDAIDEALLNLWDVITTTEDIRTSELWSWTVRNGTYMTAPFGQSGEHQSESNAAQLWSTVYLAVRPPS